MRTVSGLILIAVLSLCAAEESTTYGVNDDLNVIDPKPSARLDPYIRKALLRALSELEESDQTTGTDETSATGEDITETLPTEPAKEGIHIHSFVANGASVFDNSTNNSPTVFNNNVSVLSTTVGNLENQLPSASPTLSPYNEVLQAKATANIHQRSIASTTKAVVETLEKKTTYRPIYKTTKSTTTSTTTTTTTTPKPTHNDDGENIEDVDKRDVQVFQAPLVAAFTVQQDEQGLPKRVIPIFQQTNHVDTARPLLPPTISNVITPSHGFTIPQPELFSQQLSLQKQLEEKQRYLEEQLRVLLLQQKQQEEYLRKQQLIIHQKEVQRQQQIHSEQNQAQRPLLAQQQALPTTNPANFQIQKSVTPNSFVNQNHQLHQQSNNQVFTQSSAPLVNPTQVTNRQQLPNREAVDFLIQLRTHQPDQFPLQENHLPQGIGSFLQPAPLVAPLPGQQYQQGIALNQIRAEPLGHKQNTRIFRQEAGVGNFGINQNYNRFNTFSPMYTNRFFPNNRQYNSDFELRQLLSQNVLNGRAHEDLNIVTKVLSLNHGIPLNNNVSNRLPFDSRRHI